MIQGLQQHSGGLYEGNGWQFSPSFPLSFTVPLPSVEEDSQGGGGGGGKSKKHSGEGRVYAVKGQYLI